MLGLILLGLLAAPSLAGGSAYLDPDKPPANNLGPLITDTAVPIGQGEFAVQPLAAFNFQGGQFSPNWRRVSSHGDFYSLQLPMIFTYGLAPNVEMWLLVPYLHNWARSAELPTSPGVGSANFGGLGDTTLAIKYQFQEETALLPTCTAFAGFGFPTGHHRRLNPAKLGTDLLGSGAYKFTPGLNLSKWLRPIYLYANLWYTMPTTATVDGERIHERDLVTLNVCAQWILTEKWSLLLEFYGNWQGGNLLGPQSRLAAQALMGLVVGWEYNLNEHWSFAGGLAVDVAGKNVPYHYAPLLTLQYTF
ncbi:MAG: transporter [Syntrophales bacterium]|nr:transporter [Syntrophales bacterium]